MLPLIFNTSKGIESIFITPINNYLYSFYQIRQKDD